MKKNPLLSSALFFLGIVAAQAQYTDLHDFNGPQGKMPFGSLTLSKSGTVFYGMTAYGGAYNSGCIFSMDTDGTAYSDIFDFSDTSGLETYGSLTLSVSGTVLYGMTQEGGNNFGNIFSIHTDGSGFKNLFKFNYTDGANPQGDLTLLGNKMYGMTYEGGAHGQGTIFEIDTDGARFTELYDFWDTSTANGYYPSGSLILSADSGKLFGVTSEGGLSYGIIFSIDTGGAGYKTLFIFGTGTLGDAPVYEALVLSPSGRKLYGITGYGGPDMAGNIFSIDTDGTGYADLHDFIETDGYRPEGSVTLSGGTLYGMSLIGGAGIGNIFSVDTDGSAFSNLYNFSTPTGAYPYGSLIATNGAVYGMTEGGGANDSGLIFRYRDANIATAVSKVSAMGDELKIYPNPSTGIFNLVVSARPERGQGLAGTQQAVSIEIYNTLGEKVYSTSYQPLAKSYQLELSDQPDGVYLYRVLAEDGSLVGQGKAVVER